ncbi:hypothetical protein [Aliikangiella sp. G2MR2-5]|uniref:hypothetical protein n=1 Tax=Aliikangiella sp. G2MR2-5 TaxID=2788943 RepID=UPI0018AC7462|nr:hypothetical protein [Aliikangiella sp. G2MR2-5]
MEKVIYGKISLSTIQIVKRDDKFYIRYDAGAHQIVWREDEITESEVVAMLNGQASESQVLSSLQQRLLQVGVKPYVSNWSPKHS